MVSIAKNFYHILIVVLIIAIAFVFAGCEKINLSEIRTDCYYLGQCDDDTYIIKFDAVASDKADGKCYKVENEPVAKEQQFSIEYV